MRKIFLDTNVVLDSAIPERENYLNANAVLSLSDYDEIDGCVSFLTVANCAYILKRGRTEREMVAILRDTMKGLTILPMDNSQVEAAYDVDASDFEDILQYECAKAAECEVIVTSNVRHFKFCKDIKVISTSDFARQFADRRDDKTIQP